MTKGKSDNIQYRATLGICIAIAIFVVVVMPFVAWRRSEALSKQQASPAGIATTPTPTPATPPTKYVPPPPPTKGYYKHVGFNGSFFRSLKPGDIEGLEGGLVAMYAKDGAMWLIDAEPSDNHGPLAQRKVYLTRISGELIAKRCGVWLPDMESVPARCIEEERILSWRTAKAFMKSSGASTTQLAELEKFLEQRSRKE